MDEVEKELRKIRKRAYQRRNRDTYGRFFLDGRARRSEGLNIRLTAAERDAIRSTAAAAGETITDTVIHAVRVYGTTLTYYQDDTMRDNIIAAKDQGKSDRAGQGSPAKAATAPLGAACP